MSSPVPPAGVAETHISVLFFVGDRTYKLKKPVAPGFLDFSTRAARREACHAEVAVNRRFAPDVYLGVADVTGPDGAICDHLVVMRRMPPERRLAELVRRGDDVDADLWRLARIMASCHAAAPTSPAMAQVATAAAVGRRWDDNTATLEAAGEVLDQDLVAHVAGLARRYLAGRDDLFARRISEGRIRDGHGDLQAEDIFCLADGPRVLDAIEFDERLRWGDVLADVAFLAMDLERLGRADLGARFVAAYRELSGENWPDSLAHHYVAYRAHVRAKVACLRAAQGDPAAAGQARRLLDLARAHLERARIRLVLVGGLPGTGKSTLAAGLAGAGAGVVLRSDEIRKDLAGLGHEVSTADDVDRGLYDDAHTEATYRELLDRAGRVLARGESAVLDASWTSARWRAEAAARARSAAADLVALRCTCPPPVAGARLRDRRGDASDATPAVAAALAAREDPWPDAVPIPTEGPPAEAVASALRILGGSPAGHWTGA